MPSPKLLYKWTKFLLGCLPNDLFVRGVPNVRFGRVISTDRRNTLIFREKMECLR